MRTAEDFMHNGDCLRVLDKYGNKVQRVYEAAEFGARRTFDNSFALFSMEGGKSKTL